MKICSWSKSCPDAHILQSLVEEHGSLDLESRKAELHLPRPHHLYGRIECSFSNLRYELIQIGSGWRKRYKHAVAATFIRQLNNLSPMHLSIIILTGPMHHRHFAGL